MLAIDITLLRNCIDSRNSVNSFKVISPKNLSFEKAQISDFSCRVYNDVLRWKRSLVTMKACVSFHQPFVLSFPSQRIAQVEMLQQILLALFPVILIITRTDPRLQLCNVFDWKVKALTRWKANSMIMYAFIIRFENSKILRLKIPMDGNFTSFDCIILYGNDIALATN